MVADARVSDFHRKAMATMPQETHVVVQAISAQGFQAISCG